MLSKKNKTFQDAWCNITLKGGKGLNSPEYNIFVRGFSPKAGPIFRLLTRSLGDRTYERDFIPS